MLELNDKLFKTTKLKNHVACTDYNVIYSYKCDILRLLTMRLRNKYYTLALALIQMVFCIIILNLQTALLSTAKLKNMFLALTLEIHDTQKN